MKFCLRAVAAVWLMSLALIGAPSKPTSPVLLIAHRGGVVEDKYPDNSAAALEAAVQRGYRMIEVDIRESKDGILVVRHDPDFNENYGDNRAVRDLTWDQISQLRSKLANQRIWQFEDLVKAARASGLRLMLDSKDPHSADFCAKVETILRRHEMLADCYVIGTRDAMDHFVGKALVGAKFGLLKSKLEADPNAVRQYFLFGQGNMTNEMIEWALARGVKVVSSINAYHYYNPATMKGRSRSELEAMIMAAARQDIERHRALGVTEFQIDSEFDRWFLEQPPASQSTR
jgi:glycerophosphoryl diester phosphodiesterase